MAEDIKSDFEELLKKNSHVVELRNKIGDVCDGKKLGDIETAMLMFLSNVYMVHLDYEMSINRCAQFSTRMISLLQIFQEAEENYKGKYVI